VVLPLSVGPIRTYCCHRGHSIAFAFVFVVGLSITRQFSRFGGLLLGPT